MQEFFAIHPDLAAKLERIDRPITVVDGATELHRAVNHMSPAWSPLRTVVRVNDRMWHLGDDYASLRDTWLQRHPEEFSGLKYALQTFGAESPRSDVIVLVVRPTEWCEVRALHEAIPSGALQAALPRFLKSLFDLNVSLIPNITGVHAIVETSDAKLVINQRSKWVHYHPRCWSASFEEGLDFTDFEAGSGAFHQAAARGVNEELLPGGIVSAEDFVLLSVIVEHELLNPSLVAFGSLAYNSRDLLNARQRLFAKQSDTESSRIKFVPFELDILASLVIRGEVHFPRATMSVARWHPTARYRIVAAMAYRFGLEEATRALRRVSPRPRR